MGIFDFLKKNRRQDEVAPPTSPTPPKEGSTDDGPSVYKRRVKVAGVTFKNDDGTSRQKILRDIYNRKKPFDKKLDVSFEEFEHEGNPAYYVMVNGFCIGVVEKSMSAFITANRSRLLCISDFRVNWFTDDDDDDDDTSGERTYYANAKILIRSKK